MDELPSTRLTLLGRLRDVRNDDAWNEFVDLYAPLAYNLARRHGLQDADAGDVTQEVLRAAVRSLPGFTLDPRRGTFRSWLFTVARNELRKNVNARRRAPRVRGGADGQDWLKEQPALAEDEAHWNREYQERLFAWAAELARPTFREATWQAFWQTAVEGREPRAVAAALGISTGAVYIARSRVMSRIRQLIRNVDETDPGS